MAVWVMPKRQVQSEGRQFPRPDELALCSGQGKAATAKVRLPANCSSQEPELIKAVYMVNHGQDPADLEGARLSTLYVVVCIAK